MKTEIEAKFVDVDIEDVRGRLREIGAECEQPMRLMRRVAIDSEYMRTGKDSFLRVRDEGDKVTMTYKQFDDLSLHGAKEIEVIVNDFEQTIALLTQAGLAPHTYQETKRETWRFKSTEIMIDEWPWLNPYVEIESDSGDKVRETADQLGFSWNDAVFGDVMAAYRVQYPHLNDKETIGSVAEVKFNTPLPDFLQVSKGGRV